MPNDGLNPPLSSRPARCRVRKPAQGTGSALSRLVGIDDQGQSISTRKVRFGTVSAVGWFCQYGCFGFVRIGEVKKLSRADQLPSPSQQTAGHGTKWILIEVQWEASGQFHSHLFFIRSMKQAHPPQRRVEARARGMPSFMGNLPLASVNLTAWTWGSSPLPRHQPHPDSRGTAARTHRTTDDLCQGRAERR